MGTVIIKNEIDFSSKAALAILLIIFLWSLIRYLQEKRKHNDKAAQRFYKRSFIAIGTFILFIVRHLLLIACENWVNETGATAPIYLILQICTPLFWGLTGWCVTDAVFERFDVKFSEKNWTRYVRFAGLIVVGAYILYLIPNVIYEVSQIIQNITFTKDNMELSYIIDAIRVWLNNNIGLNGIYKFLLQIFYIGNNWITWIFIMSGISIRFGKKQNVTNDLLPKNFTRGE